MFLETEVYYLLVAFFAVVILLKSAFLLRRYISSRNTALVWFAGEILLLIMAFYYFYRCIINVPDLTFSMYSEKQSTMLAYAGMFWGISEILEIVGICKIVKAKNNNNNK